MNLKYELNYYETKCETSLNEFPQLMGFSNGFLISSWSKLQYIVHPYLVTL